MATLYAEVGIGPHHSGFGMWDRDPNAPDELWEDRDDLLYEVRENLSLEGAEVYKLGTDDLPENVEDIRGLIYGEPDQVYAVVYPEDHHDFPGHVNYFGIDTIITVNH